MLKLLFHRSAWIVRFLNGTGFVLGVLTLAPVRNVPIAHILVLLQYSFLNGCAFYPWYRSAGIVPRPSSGTSQRRPPSGTSQRRRGLRGVVSTDKDIGIRLHFRKAQVPTAYIAALYNALYLAEPLSSLSWITNGLLGVMSAVNLILILLHHLDPHWEPPNLYSTGRAP